MDERLKRLRKCPFCKSDHTKGHYTSISKLESGYVISHHCDPEIPDVTVSVSSYGATVEEAIERWNRCGQK